MLAWFLREDTLRGSVTAPDATETLASNPVQRSSHDEVARALSVLGTREGRREIYEKITERAGLRPAARRELAPAAHQAVRLGGAGGARRTQRRAAARRSSRRPARSRNGGSPTREGLDLVLTDEGREVAARLSAAREESLAELLGDWWGPDRPTDLVKLVEELNAELCGSDAERPHDGLPAGP